MRNTHFSQFIPPGMIQKSAGTWTATLAGDLVSDNRSANDSVFNLFVPLALPGNSQYRKGSRLKDVRLYYAVGTAALDGFATVAVKRVSLPATGTAVSGADVPITLDAAHDTAAERLALGDHTLSVTLNAPVYLGEGEGYVLFCALDAAATSVFKLFGAAADYEFAPE